MSGGYVHKVIDNQFIVFTKEELINELKNIESVQEIKNMNAFTIIQYQESSINQGSADAGRISANCGSDLTQEYFQNYSGCNRDRRVFVHGNVHYIISGYQYTPHALAEAYGRRRHGPICFWADYSTELYTRNCSFTATIYINGVTDSYTRTMTDYAGTSPQSSYTIFNQDLLSGPITWSGGIVPTIQFTKIHLEAASTGSNGNWAVIDCQ